jgi:Rod binding domain-containing protein
MSSPIDTSTSKSYMDFSGLGELRGKAQQNQDKALKESAQQFEGMFIQMMMKSMREANAPMKDEDNQSHAMETFEGLFDKEVSLQMSKRGALGVAAYMERAVKQQGTPQPSTEVNRCH